MSSKRDTSRAHGHRAQRAKSVKSTKSAKDTQQAQTPSGPQRTCVGCRRQDEQSRLLRLVRSPDGEVCVDHPHRLGGRGAYVCSSVDCLKRALRSPRLGTFIGGPITTPNTPELTKQIQQRIGQRIDGLLASAGRARAVALGANQVEETLRQGSAKLVIVAGDVSPRVRSSIETLAARYNVPVSGYGDRAALGFAFARSQIGAAALEHEGLALAVQHELELLSGVLLTDKELTNTSSLEDMALERAT